MANPFVHVEFATTDLDKAKVILPVAVQLAAARHGYGRRHELHDDQCRRGYRRRHDEASGSRCAIGLAGLCAGRRRHGGDSQGKVARRHESCAMSPRYRTQVHSRSLSTRPARRWGSGSRRRSDCEMAGHSVTVAAADGSGLEAYLAVPGAGERAGSGAVPGEFGSRSGHAGDRRSLRRRGLRRTLPQWRVRRYQYCGALPPPLGHCAGVMNALAKSAHWASATAGSLPISLRLEQVLIARSPITARELTPNSISSAHQLPTRHAFRREGSACSGRGGRADQGCHCSFFRRRDISISRCRPRVQPTGQCSLRQAGRGSRAFALDRTVAPNDGARITTLRRCGKNTRSTNSAHAMSRRRCARWWPSPMSTTSR